MNKRPFVFLILLFSACTIAGWVSQSFAYVEAPHSLGQVIQLSSNIVVLRVERVDREKSLILYRKVEDLKGVHPTDVIKHNIGRGGNRPGEWKETMDWAEPGKLAVFFHNGGASETCIGTYWYQCYAGGDWWNHSHGEPYLLRTFAGNPDKLIAAIREILAGKEVLVPCMVSGNMEDLHQRRAKIQRLKCSLQRGNYDAQRDFAGWGGEDLRRLAGMPGFSHYSSLARVDPEAQAISSVDFDGDGKMDLVLAGAGRIALLQNSGESLNEVSLPGVSGCRAAVWADYNGDGQPDLLLAATTGPRLYTNLGKGRFRDDSHLLPRETCYTLTAAAWIDYDGDGKPDLLLANGYHGLRLYRNISSKAAAEIPRPPRLGKWHYFGPLDNTGNRAFDATHPVEKKVDLTRKHPGKNGETAVWREGNFPDGMVNNLKLFRPQNNENAAVYLYREIDSAGAMDLPISLGSDDTLSVWLNGQKLLGQNVQRAAAPDQERVTLKLRPGKNQLLLKICQGNGDWAFYFKAGDYELAGPREPCFVDVSAQVGLGPEGIGSQLKGDTLTVADVNGDGRPDVLYGVGTGMLLLNTPGGFVLAPDSGIVYQPGKVGPVFGDFDNDGHLDLFVPQRGTCKLFRGDGKGHFADVTGKAGDLALPVGWATCAAWGDFDNDGHLDLVVGCLQGPNRFFHNRGDGTFADWTEKIGLGQRIFNTQAVCLVDLNNDGVLDMVFNNEGQESCVLLGNKQPDTRGVAVTLQTGAIGSCVTVRDKQGRTFGLRQISGGDGRGGQQPPQARFVLPPGTYQVQVRESSGRTWTRELTVAGSPLRTRIDEGNQGNQP
jgi:hypothetical protein